MTRALYLRPWRVDLTVRDRVIAPVSGAELARAVVAAVETAGAPSPASIGLILSNDGELAELNAIYLGKDGATDVLSFPLLPPNAFPTHAAGTDGVTGMDRGSGKDRNAGTDVAEFPLPPGRRRHLGDIVISVERAIEQAASGRGGQTADVRWAAADELRLLATHGALHICGWDHAEPDDEAAMRAVEARLLLKPGRRSGG